MPALVPPEVWIRIIASASFFMKISPQVTMDPQWQQKIEQDIKEAQETALPEDDEDL